MHWRIIMCKNHQKGIQKKRKTCINLNIDPSYSDNFAQNSIHFVKNNFIQIN